MPPKKQQIDGYLSDESDFYGTENNKEKMRMRENQFPFPSFKDHLFGGDFSLTRAANKASEKARKEQSSISLQPPYFPRDGDPSCRQSTENVDEFLLRLPPRTTEVSNDIQWIWITNPVRQGQQEPLAMDEDLDQGEGLVARRNISRFITSATESLESASMEMTQVEQEFRGKPAAKKIRALTEIRQNAERMIKATALKCDVRSGKWMLFVDPADVNEVWSRVAHAVTDNLLGPIAKVAPRESFTDREARLICIYTRDFSELTDVKRVVEKINQMGLINGRKGLGIYYKCDAYTHLGINSKNEWNIKASSYSSKEILASTEAEMKRKFVDGEDNKSRETASKKIAQ